MESSNVLVLDDDQQQKEGNQEHDRNTSPRTLPHDMLCNRCLLIRNLPKGFVYREDIGEENLRIPIQRMAYCETSKGTIIVEFASKLERRQALELDRHRKTRRRRLGTIEAPLQFKIKVYLERCISERFVKGFFNSSSSHTNESIVESKESEQSLSKRSPSVAKRCIMIRRFSDSDDARDMENQKIPGAPAYRSRSEAKSQKTVYSKKKTQPMEIHRGNAREKILRRAMVSYKHSIMIVELESEDSVNCLMTMGAGAQDDDHPKNITDLEDSESLSALPTATLSVPVELHPVRSENYAKRCLEGIGIFASNVNGVKINGNIQSEADFFAQSDNFLGDDNISSKLWSKSTDLERMSPDESAEYCEDNTSDAQKNDEFSDQKSRIQDLEREVRELLSERHRLMAEAERDQKELLQCREKELVNIKQAEIVKESLQQLESKHRDLKNENDGLKTLLNKSRTDNHRIAAERDSIEAEYEKSLSIWESRFRREMDDKRKNTEKEDRHLDEVCAECEIVRFYSGLASKLGEGKVETNENNGEHN
mmetsp:Transcript_23563/g.65394  ORF Transcript_23563/g.65394 Transcript_23563/m.65394 type:complete len:538 (+) Transcript_23563:218-1831(+)